MKRNTIICVAIIASFLCGVLLDAQFFKFGRNRSRDWGEIAYGQYRGKFGQALLGNTRQSSSILLHDEEGCGTEPVNERCLARSLGAATVDAENGGEAGMTALFLTYSNMDNCEALLRAKFWHGKFSAGTQQLYVHDKDDLMRKIAKKKCI